VTRFQIKRLDRYIGRHALGGFFLTLSVLVALLSFFELLAQINDVGKGDFRLADAFYYTALTMPKQAADLMPVSALLGSIIGLGMMADRHELTAMQAAGISVQRISAAVVGTSVILMLVAILVAEFIAPPLYQNAHRRRSEAIYGQAVTVSKSGFWVRHGRFFIHVDKPLSPRTAADIELYEVDEAGNLKQFLYARSATLQEDGRWLLTDVEQKRIDGSSITGRKLADYPLEAFLTPGQMAILQLPPESLALTDLYQFITSLRARGENAEAYSLAFWQKICLPVTTAVMVLLSLTFIFGSTRTISAAQRIAGGTLVGTLFFLANQILGHLGLLFNLSPILTTLAPAGLILVVALGLLRRAF
jgi:lipopolysaccharide export system permease protein